MLIIGVFSKVYDWSDYDSIGVLLIAMWLGHITRTQRLKVAFSFGWSTQGKSILALAGSRLVTNWSFSVPLAKLGSLTLKTPSSTEVVISPVYSNNKVYSLLAIN